MGQGSGRRAIAYMLDQSLGGFGHSGTGREEPVMVIRASIFEVWLKTLLKVGVKIVK